MRAAQLPSQSGFNAVVYTNIFYFIIVFSLFSLYSPREFPAFSRFESVCCVVLSYPLFYFLVCYFFRRLENKISFESARGHVFSTLHGRVITNCTVAAVGFYSVFVYFFDMKYYLVRIPLLNSSEVALNAAGITLFFLFLLIIWTCAYASYRSYYDTTISLQGYIGSHLRLNVSIIIPWFLFSLIMDMFRLLPETVSAHVLQNTVSGYILFGCMMIALACFFPWILVRVWKCTSMPPGGVRLGIERFCRDADFRCGDIFLWDLFDGKLITAGVLGFARKFRYLLISPALIDILDRDELEAVVAHEIGHVKCRHMIFYLVFAAGYMIFAYAFFNSVYFGLLSQDVFFDIFITAEGMLRPQFYIIPGLVFLGFLLVYFRFLFGVFSRNFERQSDAYAVKIKGTAGAIIRSLEKIALVGSHSKTAPNWHHYSIQERIDFLKKCDEDRNAIRRHDKKVVRMIAGYLVVLIALVAGVYGLNRSVLGRSELQLIQKVVERKLELDTENPALHFILGNIYYEKRLYFKAEQEYIRTLALQPNEPEVLNNLAWLYATAEDETARNPGKALELSLVAARIDSSPHILDTLAESYFVNGYYLEAVETIKKAIRKKPENMIYYKEQMQKFMKSLRMQNRQKEYDRPGSGFISL